MPLFTDEQMLEICRARERLLAYKDKIQCYPTIAEPELPQPQVVEHIHRHSDMGKQEFDLLQQTALKTKHLEKRLAEREKPKAQAKRFGYKGIK